MKYHCPIKGTKLLGEMPNSMTGAGFPELVFSLVFSYKMSLTHPVMPRNKGVLFFKKKKKKVKRQRSQTEGISNGQRGDNLTNKANPHEAMVI